MNGFFGNAGAFNYGADFHFFLESDYEGWAPDYQLIHRQKTCQEKNKLILTFFSNIFRYIHV
jgi:hypothetical protein